MACGWVEHLCWSEDGRLLAAAAGRTAVVASVAVSAPESRPQGVGVCAKVVHGEEAPRDGVSTDTGVGAIVSGAVSAITSVRTATVAAAADPAAESAPTTTRFAVGGYGGTRWLELTACAHSPTSTSTSTSPRTSTPMPTSAPTPPLAIGATATLAVTASPDGRFLAVGCLDKRMRIFALGSDVLIKIIVL